MLVILKVHHASDCFSFFTLMLRQSPQAAVVPPPKKEVIGRYREISIFLF